MINEKKLNVYSTAESRDLSQLMEFIEATIKWIELYPTTDKREYEMKQKELWILNNTIFGI